MAKGHQVPEFSARHCIALTHKGWWSKNGPLTKLTHWHRDSHTDCWRTWAWWFRAALCRSKLLQPQKTKIGPWQSVSNGLSETSQNSCLDYSLKQPLNLTKPDGGFWKTLIANFHVPPETKTFKSLGVTKPPKTFLWGEDFQPSGTNNILQLVHWHIVHTTTRSAV